MDGVSCRRSMEVTEGLGKENSIGHPLAVGVMKRQTSGLDRIKARPARSLETSIINFCNALNHWSSDKMMSFMNQCCWGNINKASKSTRLARPRSVILGTHPGHVKLPNGLYSATHISCAPFVLVVTWVFSVETSHCFFCSSNPPARSNPYLGDLPGEGQQLRQGWGVRPVSPHSCCARHPGSLRLAEQTSSIIEGR